ncbi:MAG TPA: type I restriction endonuclease subunit R, partial [Bacteroidales bacterium]|nr:type I restriction endonuclease subunit R [Bacteroidales bacterium]
MAKQPEQILEEQLVQQLTELGYGLVRITNEAEIINNLKTQLQKHNGIHFSDKEFEKVLNILNKGSVFEKAKTLREKQHIIRDNGENLYFEFIQTEH